MRRYRAIIIGLLALVGSPTSTARARAQADDRQDLERRAADARKACNEGKVKDGIALLADLYVTTGQSYWLYNQGRCYEENRQFGDAIARFKDYLRESPQLPAEEVAKVRTHIAEVERAHEGTASVVPQRVVVPPALHARREPVERPALTVQTTPALPAHPSKPAPLYRRRWFLITAAGTVVAGLVTGLILATRDPKTATLCPMSECDFVTGVPRK
jgi:hypothetical protein